VDAYEFFENPPKGSTLARAPVLLNGFLIANRLPAFDTTKPVESAIQLLNKVCESIPERMANKEIFSIWLCVCVTADGSWRLWGC
jgi:hypothetical protein